MSSSLNQYSKNTVGYDFLNKFMYRDVSKLPALLSIKLTFNIKNYNFKNLLISLAALEIISFNKCSLIKSKTSVLSLKIRKGSPIGCTVTLRKNKCFRFILLLLNKYTISKQSSTPSITGLVFNTNISNVITLPELENNYHFFKELNNLSVSIFTSAKTDNELYYLLKSHKISLQT